MIFQGFTFTEYFIVLVRTAACVMILPGFSMGQIPIQVRLYVAIALSLSIYLLISDSIQIEDGMAVPELSGLIFSEIFIAMVLTIPIRLFFLSLSFLGEIIMQFIGLNPIPGTPIGDDQATSVLSSLFNITAVVLFFSSGLIFSFIAAVAQSFIILPPGEILAPDAFVQSLSEHVASFFNVMLRLGAPIIIYGIVMNILAGLVNKLTPQIPVYFVSTPFLICGGLVILTWIGDDILFLFNMELDRLINSLF